jgi:hypothetical protein
MEAQMKQLVAMLAGFCLTLAIFAGGALTAVFFVNAKPVPVHRADMNAGALWTSKAVRVQAAPTDLERLPARLGPQPVETKAPSNAASIDPGATASVSTENAPKASMNTAHSEWCLQRYRSYDPADDSYNAYSGVRRKCISPYSRGGDPEVVDASATSIPTSVSDEVIGALSSQHIQSCFERYRSYRPEDNTYQPYDGGPRRQCE